MTDLTTEIGRLHDRILEADIDRRYLFQPRLAALVEQMDVAGVPVPAGIRQMLEELTNDAIEAQFDNMPV